MMNTSRSAPILALLRATIMLSFAAFASAQSSPQAAHDKPLRFDVVSIRPSGDLGKSGGMQILPDGFQAIGMAIESTVYVAYVPAPFSSIWRR